tara:strand:- start:813 stop:2006 length:1194 start_codon:yes stop_codon:yes gene_type:complete
MIIALIGKPSVGKSTFFKAATLADIEIAERPFTTIKSNSGIGYVKIDCADSFFKVQCNPRLGFCLNHKRFVPIDLMDIAGLVEGAHSGKGLGNEFLNDIREADALIHIIDISGSTNAQGEKVQPLTNNPIEDLKVIENELDMWYYQILQKGWEKFARTISQEKKNIVIALAKQLSGLKVTESHVENSIKKLNISEDPMTWSDNNLKELATTLRKLSKPMIIAANKIDIQGSQENLKKMQKEFKDYEIIPCSADSELALREASKNKLIEYIPGENDFKIINENITEQQSKALTHIKENILKKYKTTGLQEVLNKTVFNLLKYIAIFPGGLNNLKDSKGNILPDCFLLPEESTALDFAFKLHTDIGNSFIKAIDVKTKKVIGKDHHLKNLDVIEIITKK